MLARSERLALADASGSPENRAAVLAMIGAQYGAMSEDATAARLFEKGLALLVDSNDGALRAELTCLHASSIASLGQTDAAVRAIEHELEHLQGDPQTAAYCLLYRSFIASAAHDAIPTLRYAKEGLDRFHAASQATAADEGLFLGAVGRGYYLNGQIREADEYFRRAMQRYADLGREASANSITVLNNWAVTVDSAGTPKQALEIYNRALTLLTEHNQGAPPPPVILGNRARALEALGRYKEARVAYEAEVSRAEQQGNALGQAHGLSGLASTSQSLHDSAAAAHYMERLTAVLSRAIPVGTPPWKARALVQGRLDMDSGRFDSAREQFTSALGNPNTSTGMTARLGKSEAEWRGGDAATAADDARLALKTASAMQGNLPYSIYTGLSWVALGRALLQLGRDADARQAFESAAAHLSNTVDDGHPALVEARDLLATRFAHTRGD
jgi:tetratricopeptide (TPR) repeat protein